MSVICGVAAVAQLCMALLLMWNRARTPGLLPVAALPAEEPSVLVVVPARNEEQNIEGCVVSLLRQRYRNLRVLVVDDHSTDRTAALVRALGAGDARLCVMAAPDLPPGWLGKPHALHAGTRGASADYLLFIDADLRLHEDTVARAVHTAQARGAALLTLIPRLVTESFFERAVQPVVAAIIFALLDPVKVGDPRSRVASANGPFLLFSRAGYERIGGHASVAGEVVEDLRLAEATKRAGLRLCYVHGVEAASLRMYDSLPALIAGWSKNFYAALGRGQWLAPLLGLLLLWVFTVPTVAALAALPWALLHGPSAPVAWAFAAYGADLLSRLMLRRGYGITARGVRSLGGVLTAYILCNSVYRAATGKAVSWRGRQVTPATQGQGSKATG